MFVGDGREGVSRKRGEGAFGEVASQTVSSYLRSQW